MTKQKAKKRNNRSAFVQTLLILADSQELK